MPRSIARSICATARSRPRRRTSERASRRESSGAENCVFELTRQRATPDLPCARPRMHEPDLARVEEVPREPGDRRTAVERVPSERTPDAGEVNADLMTGRGARRHLDLGEAPVRTCRDDL